MEKTNRPYWEQVYSMLETVDVATGERTVRKRFDSLIEAPNWLPDGNTLLYNAGGSLWLFDLASGESRKVDTGSAARCNNDHVLSPDGRQVGLSSAGPEDRSLVYVAPPLRRGAPAGDPGGPQLPPRLVPGRQDPGLLRGARRGI